MRVILITPYAYQNQGVRLLAAVLRRAGHDAQILLLKQWGNNNVQEPTAAEWELLEQHVADARPGLIGISLGSPYLPVGIELAQRLQRVSKAHLVWGGVHPTISPEDLRMTAHSPKPSSLYRVNCRSSHFCTSSSLKS